MKVQWVLRTGCLVRVWQAWEEGEWDYRPEDYGRSAAPRRQAMEEEAFGQQRAPPQREENGEWGVARGR